jgi:dihydrofolate synthase/folylpolyglutamate synthase
MRGKDVRGVLTALAPLLPRFVFTRVADPGALPPEELAGAWASLGGEAVTAPDPRAALALAADEPVVVAGSLYLVGAVRGMITGEHEEA